MLGLSGLSPLSGDSLVLLDLSAGKTSGFSFNFTGFGSCNSNSASVCSSSEGNVVNAPGMLSLLETSAVLGSGEVDEDETLEAEAPGAVDVDKDGDGDCLMR